MGAWVPGDARLEGGGAWAAGRGGRAGGGEELVGEVGRLVKGWGSGWVRASDFEFPEKVVWPRGEGATGERGGGVGGCNT